MRLPAGDSTSRTGCAASGPCTRPAGCEEDDVARGLDDAGPYVRAWTIQLALEDGKSVARPPWRSSPSWPSPTPRRSCGSTWPRPPAAAAGAALGHPGRPARARRGRRRPQPAADVLVRRRAAGRGRSRAGRCGWPAGGDDPAAPVVHGPADRGRRHAGGDRAAGRAARRGAEDSDGAGGPCCDGLNEALEGRAGGCPCRPPGRRRRATARSRRRPERPLAGDGPGRDLRRPDGAGRDATDPRRRRRRRRRRAARRSPRCSRPRTRTCRRCCTPCSTSPTSAARPCAAWPPTTTRQRPPSILEVYPTLTPAERRDALNTLASRVGYARALLDAVGAKKVPAADLSADLVRQLRNLKDADLDEQIAEVWGMVRDTPPDKAKLDRPATRRR